MALFGPRIQGVEVTQAIQYYESASHLSDPADQQPDNSVTLVAGKPAWVRTYVRSGWLFGSSSVTGSVTVRRRVLGFLWVKVGTLSPQPPGAVTAYRELDYATERENLGYTLNFIIPATMMCGRIRLDVRVKRRFLFFSLTHRRTLTVDATLRQTLRLAGIMVGYDGPESLDPGAPNVTLPAPTIADLQTTSAWTLLTFPVRSSASYRIAGTITWDQPLTDPPSCSGCCSPNWIALNTAVQAVKIADGNHTDVLYYGLLATGIPMGPIVGCNSGGVSTGTNGAGVTMAHELGHACGRPHSPCGTGGDSSYPAYEPYDPAGTPTASIGEYGLDINTGTIKPPEMFKDFMSYCGPKWISLYIIGKLTNIPALDPGRACVDWPWWTDVILYDRTLMAEEWLPDPPPDPSWLERDVQPERLISLIGIQRGPEEVEITSVMRLETRAAVPNGRALELRAELVDERGQIISSATVYDLRSLADGDCADHQGPTGRTYPRLIQAFVRDVEIGSALRIRSGEREIWRRRATGKAPTVGDVSVELLDDDLKLSWSFESETEHEAEAAVQWSADDGRSWQALGAGLRGRSAVLDARGLPAGEVLIRLLVSDGFQTAQSAHVAVTVGERPLQISILSPREDQTVAFPGSLRLWGMAGTAGGELVDVEDVQWLIDGQPVASGLDAFVDTPPPGEHRATLAVRGAEDVTVGFTVAEMPVEREEDGEELGRR